MRTAAPFLWCLSHTSHTQRWSLRTCPVLISVLRAELGDKGEEKVGQGTLLKGKVEGWGQGTEEEEEEKHVTAPYCSQPTYDP